MKEDDGAEDDDETDGSQQRALCPAASRDLQERQKASPSIPRVLRPGASLPRQPGDKGLCFSPRPGVGPEDRIQVLRLLHSVRSEHPFHAARDVEKADLPVEKSVQDRKSTRLNSSHVKISYAVFCLKKKKKSRQHTRHPLTTRTLH